MRGLMPGKRANRIGPVIRLIGSCVWSLSKSQGGAADQELVVDEIAAAARENRRATDQQRQGLPALVWPESAGDLCPAGAERVALRLRSENLGPREEGRSSV
jgi:hypothetical protein